MSGHLNYGKIILNAVSSWGGFAVQLLIAFFMAPVFVHHLGDQRYGMWAWVESIIAYLMLFDLGVAASVVRYVARCQAQDDPQTLNRVVATSIVIFLIAGVCALVVACLAAVGIGYASSIPPDLAVETVWMLVLLGCNIAFSLPLHVFTAVLDGLGHYPTKTLIRAAALVLRIPFLLFVLYTDGSLITLALVITASNIGERLACVVAAKRYLPALRVSLTNADWSTFKMIRSHSLNAFLALVAGRISFQTDSIVIAAFLAPQYVTFFAIAARLIEHVKNACRSATTVLTPAASSLEAKGDIHTIQTILLTSTRWVLWLILPVQLGFVILGKPFLALWMGARYAELSYPTLLILSLPLSLTLSQSISARILYGIGKLTWFARAVLVEATANLGLSIILVQSHGIEGVAWGTTGPALLLNLFLLAYICHTLEVSVFVYLQQSFMRPLVACAGLGASWVVMVRFVAPATWTTFLVVGLLGMALYLPLICLWEFGPQRVWQSLSRQLTRLLPLAE